MVETREWRLKSGRRRRWRKEEEGEERSLRREAGERIETKKKDKRG